MAIRRSWKFQFCSSVLASIDITYDISGDWPAWIRMMHQPELQWTVSGAVMLLSHLCRERKSWSPQNLWLSDYTTMRRTPPWLYISLWHYPIESERKKKKATKDYNENGFYEWWWKTGLSSIKYARSSRDMYSTYFDQDDTRPVFERTRDDHESGKYKTKKGWKATDIRAQNRAVFMIVTSALGKNKTQELCR